MEVTADPRYSQGKQFLKERKFEDAINLFSSLLQTCNETHGEMSLMSARAYYEYGNALLIKEEEEPSDDLIGPQNKSLPPAEEEENNGEAENQAEVDNPEFQTEDGNRNDDGEGDEENADGEEGEDEVNAEEGDPTDLQVAWEVLDVARLILEKENDQKHDDLLSEVSIRLGDLMKMNGNYSSAITEYQKALAIRERISPNEHRVLSNIHYLIAVANIYLASEEGNSNPVEARTKALEHYELSKQFLQNHLVAPAASEEKGGPSEEDKEVRELIDELTETIDALKAEIAEQTGGATSSSESIRKPATTTTTIGFGSSVPATTTATLSSSTSEVKSVQVRKKQKTTHNVENNNNNQTEK